MHKTKFSQNFRDYYANKKVQHQNEFTNNIPQILYM